ncbi:hypothetical protein [Parafrankia sp. EUN1f]|uniref:hypothetical protein n=1 Tax=Parafrankia sp. EUN1f TaxID=102897 RepID=UPI0001C46D05|nr:hypothetical protein [Parafrankia sp. EUN1f]EFC80180.1 hypothetical protein FrEUN1fDRAFT_6709 [Parafrankia sp. EUN1f]
MTTRFSDLALATAAFRVLGDAVQRAALQARQLAATARRPDPYQDGRPRWMTPYGPPRSTC